MDAVVELIAVLCIQLSRFPKLLKFLKIIPGFSEYKKGAPLKILIVGYNGARNTGADVRVEAMVKQFYRVFEKEKIPIEIGLLSIDPEHSAQYYPSPTKIIPLDTIFFKDILKACSAYHVAVLSEGSCFKSKFANALTVLFMCAAGIMKKQNKLCLAYGSETGQMDWLLTSLVKKHAKKAYVISRTEQSLKATNALGLPGDLGTDTAWAFKPASKDVAHQLLKDQGWDGIKPVVGFAVINPFWWPVRPSLFRFVLLKLFGVGKKYHYDKFYFFSHSKSRQKIYEQYIISIAKTADQFVKKYNVFPVIIGMERLDLAANEFLQKQMEEKAPVFCSSDYNGYNMTAVLHALSLLVTSRYHARVLSMTGGVPSIGVSMDERLYNLLAETGHLENYYLKTDDPHLDNNLWTAMEKMWLNKETVSQELLQTIPGYLNKMETMANLMISYIRSKYS